MMNMQEKNKVDEKELFSQELENNVLGSILVSQDCYKYVKQIEIEDFYIGNNKLVFKAIQELYEFKKDINILTVKEKMKHYNQSEILNYLIGLTEIYITSATIEQNIGILKNYAVKRKLKNAAISILNKIMETDIYTDAMELKQDCAKEILDIKTESALDIKTMKDIMVESTMHIEKNYQNRDDNRYKTGFFELDKVTNGLHEQELTVIAARPGMGKTSIALNIAENISRSGATTCFISLEMSERQLGNRLISSRTGIDSHKLRCGWIDEQDFEKIGRVAAELTGLNLIINAKSTFIQEIENMVIELKEKKNIGLVIIDYLQLVKSKNKFNIREQEVAEISRKLKLLSKELNIPIIALCQLNRETVKRSKPILADLRESGAIEQDADNVIFLHADEEEKTKAIMNMEVIIAKQRNGPTGSVKLKYNRKTMTFFNNY